MNLYAVLLALMEFIRYTREDNERDLVTIYLFSPALVPGHFLDLIALTIFELKKSSPR